MCDSKDKKNMQDEEITYEKPQIIYDSVITTRAGSPILDESADIANERPVIDLFPSD